MGTPREPFGVPNSLHDCLQTWLRCVGTARYGGGLIPGCDSVNELRLVQVERNCRSNAGPWPVWLNWCVSIPLLEFVGPGPARLHPRRLLTFSFFFPPLIMIRNRLDTVSPSHINICNYQQISIQASQRQMIAIKSAEQMLMKSLLER